MDTIMRQSSLKEQMDALELLQEVHELTSHDKNNNKNNNNNSPTQTLAQKARGSLLTRFEDILSQIISIELDLLSHPPENMKTFLRHKDSVDLKNICLRMSVGESSSDRNLKELRGCLMLIVTGLLSAVRDRNDDGTSAGAARGLMAISSSLPDI